LFAQLTGLWVFYTIQDDVVVQNHLLAGEKPFIDERLSSASEQEKLLVQIMERCWEHDPKDRIDIFEAVRLLREAVLHLNHHL